MESAGYRQKIQKMKAQHFCWTLTDFFYFCLIVMQNNIYYIAFILYYVFNDGDDLKYEHIICNYDMKLNGDEHLYISVSQGLDQFPVDSEEVCVWMSLCVHAQIHLYVCTQLYLRFIKNIVWRRAYILHYNITVCSLHIAVRICVPIEISK